MKIKTVEIDGPAALAPMAGVTDAAFRKLCREQGAAYTVTEMVSARALEYNDRKTGELADLTHDEGPVFLQLFGDDPAMVGRAAKKLLKYSPAGFDINMGCPVPKIVNGGAGSALLKDPKRCAQMVAAVKENTLLPVTVKLRKGWDDSHIAAVEVAGLCAESGADAICVHGRTRDQFYEGKADWEIIREVKKAVPVPVIGNGDVKTPSDASRMLEMTGCDLIMVGRAALGNPWIFHQINAYLTESCRILPPPGIAQRIVMIRKHMEALCGLKGEYRGMREARKHVGWYLHGVRGASEFRRRAGELSTLEDLDRLLADVYRENEETEETV